MDPGENTATTRRAQGRRRPRSPRGQGAELREDLLKAATSVLSTLGSEVLLSLRAVARAAGVAPTAVYLHFDDRDALIFAVLEHLFDELSGLRIEAEEAAVATGGGDWEQLRARSLAYVRWGVANPGSYRVLYEGRALPRLEDLSDAALGQPMLDRTNAIIDRLVDAGRIDPVGGQRRAGLLLWIGLHGIVSLRINKDTIEWPDPVALADDVLMSVFRPVEA